MIGNADISGNNVVWSLMTYNDLTGRIKIDLYISTLEVECGDWGYAIGDLDQDCDVDLADFTLMAQRWLYCTTPDDLSCGYGDIY